MRVCVRTCQSGKTGFKPAIVCRGGVSIAQEDIVKPFWDNALHVHQVADGLQHSLEVRGYGSKVTCYCTSKWTHLEVILFGLPPNQNVEGLVRILGMGRRGGGEEECSNLKSQVSPRPNTSPVS